MYDIKKSFSPHSVREVFDLLSQYPDAVLTAGGTDVMISIRHRKLCEAVLISIREIPELQGISLREDGAIVIGACTCFDDICRDPLICEHLPLLAEAASQVGSPQIRHVATIGGNLCNGAVSADSAPSLLVLDAILELSSKDTTRYVPVTEFHTGPGQTVLNSGHEILTAIIIPKQSYENHGGQYLKFGQRNAMEISTLGCAATVRLSADRLHIAEMHLAFGVAANRPLRCPKIEAAVAGMTIDENLFQKIRTEVLSELSPRDSWRASRELREQLIRTQSVRAVKAAIEEAGGKNNGN